MTDIKKTRRELLFLKNKNEKKITAICFFRCQNLDEMFPICHFSFTTDFVYLGTIFSTKSRKAFASLSYLTPAR